MGSADDRARLDHLNQEGAILAGEIESIEAAIVTVKIKIADAEAAVEREAEQEKRREISRVADEVHLHAETIDALWWQSIAEFLELQTKLHKIAQSSGGRPALHVIQSASRRALISAFNRTPLQVEQLAPSERRSMADLAASWLHNIETNADRTTVKSNGKG